MKKTQTRVSDDEDLFDQGRQKAGKCPVQFLEQLLMCHELIHHDMNILIIVRF
jgi:hypothetical protein